MFSVGADIRRCTYAILAAIDLGSKGIGFGKGTAFMVSPGLIVTAAHVLNVGGDFSKPPFTKLAVLWGPEVDSYSFETVQVLAQDTERDIALLRIVNALHTDRVRFCTGQLSIGTACTYLGFLAVLPSNAADTGCPYVFSESSQEGPIHSFVTERRFTGRLFDYYLTDTVMYSGLSGCPGFTRTGEVFGLHVESEVKNGQRTLSRWVPADDIISFLARYGVRL